MEKVLVANRGEIAVRVIRACRDAGLRSVAVYADQDRDAPHARFADEAYGLHGSTAADTYLDVGKILAVAAECGADAIHPGYGFLSEDAGFARAVRAANLTWIGPPPEAIEQLGDKVAAREIARRVRAPLAPGTDRPVAGPDEVLDFAREHGLPLAIKAVGGGGGRGLKVARTLEEIPRLLESAAREAAAAFGRGDCFVEKYLDRARHVETQCLADSHGNVVVVSTRDCSVQRRHQKLVEEAPAPFLTPEQEETLRAASKAVLAEAGYVGAGTCEFLLGEDGTISFLEVNTRLQVEHPVTEEITGIDLVQEQFRIAAGEPLGFTDPVDRRGHSVEFRINGEDVGRGFLPTPGTVTRWRTPAGPGIRVDTGIEEGAVVDGAFDSMLAKLIVTGADRGQALARARRALGEFEVDGIPTTLPLFRALLDSPEFTASDPAVGLAVHTRWLESEAALRIDPWEGDPAETAERPEQVTYTVEVGGRRLEVALPESLAAPKAVATVRSGGSAVRRKARVSSAATASDGTVLTSPMVGTVVKVSAAEGAEVSEGDVLFVIEAMKMEQPVKAHRPGVVHAIKVAAGTGVSRGAPLCEVRTAD
ncbi:biotin carboxylase N-terminal domain-containing protein [Streptomyces sp. PSKA30]|uniref:acetyl/propionyl/methylcrotonyl-CoA carboxylase subunit alpha n=1 Tax=Streptomyces sp. PSKA30 TaxID=2874597 RepID=UPI001CD0C424|nr:biotin carboxylase N-terminal domain-containing protein [Streptomyces sp. PSKA30]MBZ9641595.1 ATP-grasp domain-containing protein [Streptomyces sp. PSKA30]